MAHERRRTQRSGCHIRGIPILDSQGRSHSGQEHQCPRYSLLVVTIQIGPYDLIGTFKYQNGRHEISRTELIGRVAFGLSTVITELRWPAVILAGSTLVYLPTATTNSASSPWTKEKITRKPPSHKSRVDLARTLWTYCTGRCPNPTGILPGSRRRSSTFTVVSNLCSYPMVQPYLYCR